jgi:hypothetical protein
MMTDPSVWEESLIAILLDNTSPLGTMAFSSSSIEESFVGCASCGNKTCAISQRMVVRAFASRSLKTRGEIGAAHDGDEGVSLSLVVIVDECEQLATRVEGIRLSLPRRRHSKSVPNSEERAGGGSAKNYGREMFRVGITGATLGSASLPPFPACKMVLNPKTQTPLEVIVTGDGPQSQALNPETQFLPEVVILKYGEARCL